MLYVIVVEVIYSATSMVEMLEAWP